MRTFENARSTLPLVIVLCLSVVGFVFALSSYTVDSEIWSVSLAKYFFDPQSYHHSVYNKPLFYLILSVLYSFPLSSLAHIVTAKALFAFNSIALAYFTFKVFRAISISKRAPWFALIFMLTNPLWLAESFRIRSDLLAMCLTLASLSFYLQAQPSRKGWVWILLLGSVLATPKSLLWNIPVFIFLLSSDFSVVRNFSVRRVVGLGLMLLCLASASEIRESYQLAWSHFLQGIERASALGSSPWIVDWFFVFDSVRATPYQWAMIAVGWVVAPVVLVRAGRWNELRLYTALFMAVVCFVFYSPKLYFFLAAFLPFFILPLVMVLDSFIDRLPKYVVGAFVTALLVSFVVWSKFLFPMHEGRSSYQFIADLERFTRAIPVKVFDATGLLPRGDNLLKYIGEADQSGNAWALRELEQQTPGMVFHSSRIEVFAPKIKSELLEAKYTEIQKGIWLRTDLARDPQVIKKLPITSVEDTHELFDQRLICIALMKTPYLHWDFTGVHCF